MAQLPELDPLFSGTLPAATVEAAHAGLEHSGNAQTNDQKRDVLIVDDVPHNLRFLSTTLKEQGYQVRTVLSAKMAFSAIRMSLPDLILLDINLPDLDGYSVCRELKLSPETAEIPVIFLSALGEAKNKVAAFQNGGVDYITKPFQLEEVIARVGLQFRLKELAEDLRQKNLQLVQLAQHLKRQNDELSQARKAADCASQAKSEFLSCVSHELRTPLTAILGFNQLLMGDQDITVHQRETMGIIDRSGKHLLNLINEVLDLSKIEANRTGLNLEVFDLKDSLSGLRQMFLLEAEAKGLDLSLDYGMNVPQRVRADEQKIRQIIINLLGNALKFTAAGFVRLSLQAQELGGDAVRLCLIVEDSGPGITEADSALLFEPFRQTQVGQQAQQGTGLGLCLSRQFAQLMGGDIHLDSQVGQGSRFIVELDCEIAQADAVSCAAVSSHEGPDEVGQTNTTFSDLTTLSDPTTGTDPTTWAEAMNGESSAQDARVLEEASTEALSVKQLRPSAQVTSVCRQLKVLVVDDHLESRMLLVQLLESAGCQVKAAETGAEAIACDAEWQPQLIWMDLRLPDMDGQTAIQQIKQRISGHQPTDHPTHIVATTASVYDKAQLLAAEQSCDGLIRKPFAVSQIWDKIAELFVHDASLERSSPASTAPASSAPVSNDATEVLPRQSTLSSWSTHQQSCFMEQLERMPQSWLKRLYYSSLALDESDSQELLLLIPEDCPQLKQRLDDLFKNLRYDMIFAILDQLGVEPEPLLQDSSLEYSSVDESSVQHSPLEGCSVS